MKYSRWWKHGLWSSGLWHCIILWVVKNILEGPVASIFSSEHGVVTMYKITIQNTQTTSVIFLNSQEKNFKSIHISATNSFNNNALTTEDFKLFFFQYFSRFQPINLTRLSYFPLIKQVLYLQQLQITGMFFARRELSQHLTQNHHVSLNHIQFTLQLAKLIWSKNSRPHLCSRRDRGPWRYHMWWYHRYRWCWYLSLQSWYTHCDFCIWDALSQKHAWS